MENLLNRITINPLVNHGNPSIRKMRFSVSNMLELLAAGSSDDEILSEYPYIEKADIEACLHYASLFFSNKNSPIFLEKV